MYYYYYKEDVLEREQHYMNTLKPEYIKLKAANSRIRTKHTLETKVLINIKNKPIVVMLKTRLNLYLICKGVKVFYFSNNLVNEFTTIINVSNQFYIGPNIVSRYFYKNIPYNGLILQLA